MHLGVRAVIAKRFARIHRANLINWGLVPLMFDDPGRLRAIERGDRAAPGGAAERAGRGPSGDCRRRGHRTRDSRCAAS